MGQLPPFFTSNRPLRWQMWPKSPEEEVKMCQKEWVIEGEERQPNIIESI
jgi:hypothetical protein